jgi:hypothetical protein
MSWTELKRQKGKHWIADANFYRLLSVDASRETLFHCR